MLKTRTSIGPIVRSTVSTKAATSASLRASSPNACASPPSRADAVGELFQHFHVARAPRDADREPFPGEGARDRCAAETRQLLATEWANQP